MVPLAVGLAIVTAVQAGSDRTAERAFRLLRRAAGRPEPPAPPPPRSGPHDKSCYHVGHEVRDKTGARPPEDLDAVRT
jgi:hypothetical protein